MKLVSYNIQYGRGRDGVFDLPRIAAAVTDADVIALQEVERYWQRSGMVDQAREIADLLGDHYWIYGAGVDLDCSAGAGGDARNRRRQFGNMLLCRVPILSSRNHLLPKYGSLGPLSIQRSALECVIQTGGRLLRVYSLHLTHLSAETRMPQVERLLDIHERAPVEGGALSGSGQKDEWTQDGMPPSLPREAIFMGDFNMESDSEEYARIAGPVSPYGGRITNPHGFVDAWVAAGNQEGDGVTAEIDGRSVRLDYCFVSASMGAAVGAARIDGEAAGSDHQPLWVEIDLD